MNVELLQQVKQAILDHAPHFDMDDWGFDLNASDVLHDEPPTSHCGTVACIAGFTCLLAVGRTPDMSPGRSVAAEARAALEVNRYDSDRLFYREEWPEEFRNRYATARDRVARAQIAAERIDHFIATKGAE